MYDLAVRDVRLIGREGRWTIGVQRGKIASVVPEGTPAAAREEIHGAGKIVMPGAVDAHVHTRDPGYLQKEDAHSAAMAAVAGGITTIMAMPNCNPPMTNGAAVRYAAEHMTRQNLVDIRLVGGICAAVPGWGTSAVEAGAAALDVYDDIYSWGTQTWVRVFQTAKRAAVPVCFYLMDREMERLRREQQRAAGASDEEQIAEATDGETEAISIARIFPMANYFQTPVVLRMVSTARALEAVRQMRGLYPDAKVYVEVCVPYLFLTRDALEEQGSRAHIHPPLRRKEDMEALWRGISDGTVDYLATDHAPHAAAEKNRARLSDCASGLVGLETMLPLLLDARAEGRLSLEDIQRLCCQAPACIYGLTQKGRICAGADADLVLLDLNQRWSVCSQKGYTRGAPGPFEGRQLRGRPCMTVHRGRVVMEDVNGFPVIKE